MHHSRCTSEFCHFRCALQWFLYWTSCEMRVIFSKCVWFSQALARFRAHLFLAVDQWFWSKESRRCCPRLQWFVEVSHKLKVRGVPPQLAGAYHVAWRSFASATERLHAPPHPTPPNPIVKKRSSAETVSAGSNHQLKASNYPQTIIKQSFCTSFSFLAVGQTIINRCCPYGSFLK